MALTDQSQGAHSLLFVKDTTDGAGSTYDECYEFITESIQAVQGPMDTDGIRGSRSVPRERTRLGIRAVSGTLALHASPNVLDAWLPRIMGSAKAGNDFALGETFASFDILINRVVGPGAVTYFEYTECVVARTAFRAQAGSFLEMSMDIIGKDESITTTNAPTSGDLRPGASTTADSPYVFHDATSSGVSLIQLPTARGSAGGAEEVFDFTVVIDNAMSPRFVNSVTLTAIKPADRIITMGVTVPWIAATRDRYRQTTRGGGATAAFYNALDANNKRLTFTFADLEGPDVSPIVTGKEEIVMRLDYRARATGSASPFVANELIITNMNT